MKKVMLLLGFLFPVLFGCNNASKGNEKFIEVLCVCVSEEQCTGDGYITNEEALNYTWMGSVSLYINNVYHRHSYYYKFLGQ